MVPASPLRGGFNGSLDGLRGLAALNVVFAHYILAFFPFLLKGQYQDLFLRGYSTNFFCYQILPEPVLLGVQLSEKKTFYNGLAAISLVLSVIQGFGSVFLQSPLCRYLGRWSYALYLIHFLVLASWASWLYGFLEDQPFQDPLTLIGYLVACFTCCAIMTRLVDQPTVR
ncbi:MAG: hypothetical protein WCO47_03705 [Methylococcus sp.]|jgi:peptidoglycan/LPS O-acetylase OafA/YrhL